MGGKTFLPLLAAALAIAGCTADAAGPGVEVETITRTTDGDQILVDLRDAERAWLFDPSEGDLPIDRVLLICPNGAFMRLSHWLSEQEALLGLEVGEHDRTLFSLAATEEFASMAIEQEVECQQDCVQCPDGAWTCFDRCPETWNDGHSRETGSGNIDEPEHDPYAGSGSSGDGTPEPGSGGGSPEPYDPRDPVPPMY